MSINVSTRRAALYKTLYPAEIVVSDTFTDDDATLLTNHTPDLCPTGSAWVENRAENPHSITSNRIYGDGYSSFIARMTIDSKLSDVQIDAVLYTTYGSNATDARQPGIVFRHINGTALFAFANYAASQIQIVNSAAVVIASAAWASRKFKTEYNAQVILSGANITAIIDGNEVSTVCYDNLTATSHGLRLYDATAYADNFVITAMR